MDSDIGGDVMRRCGDSPDSSPALPDPECVACGFRKHCHGKYSEICPVLVRGSLHQFQLEERP